MIGPYRTAADKLEPEAPRRARLADRDLWPVFTVVLLVSIARVAGALARAEVFGAEPTLAFLLIVLIVGRLFQSAYERSAGEAPRG